jgi:transcriptional regulator with GAF, ATPase, and Fis domain
LHTHFDANGRPDHVRIRAYPLQDAAGGVYMMEAIQRLAARAAVGCEQMQMVGSAPAFLACVENLAVAARGDAPVLLYGETGVGKELAARFVHEQSARRAKPFVALNCAVLPEGLTESELFGHERGAFTGCIGRRQGLFEQAHGGTLFLDEVGELAPAVQAKLLRVLDSGEFRRVGGEQPIGADVRIIAATNRNLLALVAAGRFREDLYFRIAGIKVSIPPLRERRGDIPALAQVLLARLCGGKTQRCRLTRDALLKLCGYDYPGNVRELRSILQRAVACCTDGIITDRHIDLGEPALAAAQPDAPVIGLRRLMMAGAPSLKELEMQYLRELLRRHGGRRKAVAEAMGVSERTVYRRIKQFGLAESA